MTREPEPEPAMDVEVEDEEVLLSLYDPPEVQDEEWPGRRRGCGDARDGDQRSASTP